MKVDFVYNKNIITKCDITAIPKIGDKVAIDGRMYKVDDILWMFYERYSCDDVVKIVVV